MYVHTHQFHYRIPSKALSPFILRLTEKIFLHFFAAIFFSLFFISFANMFADGFCIRQQIQRALNYASMLCFTFFSSTSFHSSIVLFVPANYEKWQHFKSPWEKCWFGRKKKNGCNFSFDCVCLVRHIVLFKHIIHKPVNRVVVKRNWLHL